MLPLPSPNVDLASEQLTAPVKNLVSAAAWSRHGVKRPSVWLIGDSYIYWAAQRASDLPCGLNLGFTHADLSWRGVLDLKWLQVLPEVVAVSNLTRGPTVLVIHAGSYNVCSCARVLQLLSLMCSDFDHFATLFSNLVIVWSEVLPRVFWFGARDLDSVEWTRQVLNMRVSRHIGSKGGVVIRHRQIERDYKQLMLPDGVKLNNDGLDIFLAGLEDAIDRALVLLSRRRSSV